MQEGGVLKTRGTAKKKEDFFQKLLRKIAIFLGVASAESASFSFAGKQKSPHHRNSAGILRFYRATGLAYASCWTMESVVEKQLGLARDASPKTGKDYARYLLSREPLRPRCWPRFSSVVELPTRDDMERMTGIGPAF